ncbi:MAG: hemolysin III family protein [Acidimicrobiales bacterium]|jgi:hemolysin III|nr:hemolysin III family protein [Acidimicrobiales bacterium]
MEPSPGLVADGAVRPVKPRLRGVSHQVAFFVAIALGPVLASAASTRHDRFLLWIYAISLAALFGCSALLHRGSWSPRVLPWMRRLDHSTIFVFIAGTYTAVAGLALGSARATPLLVAVWLGAAVGVAVSVFWLHAPRWVTASCYLGVGWLAVAALPWLWSALEPARFSLLVLGGVLYSTGAVVYARKRPDPWPHVFGYHEVFHALVIAAVVGHYLLIASLLG